MKKAQIGRIPVGSHFRIGSSLYEVRDSDEGAVIFELSLAARREVSIDLGQEVEVLAVRMDTRHADACTGCGEECRTMATEGFIVGHSEHAAFRPLCLECAVKKASPWAVRNFFAIFDPGWDRFDPRGLDDLEILLGNQPEGVPLSMWRYKLPNNLPADVETYDATLYADLRLQVGIGEDEWEIGLPVEEFTVTLVDDRIRIFALPDFVLAARCESCNGLIRHTDPRCPYCWRDQQATPDGFPARPRPKKRKIL